MALDLQSVLPIGIEQDALNPAALQDALDKLTGFQTQARAQLFQLLAHAAAQPSYKPLEAALGQLCESAAYLLPDSSEAHLVQYAQHYLQLCAHLGAVEDHKAEHAVVADVTAQLDEFNTHMSKGEYTDAAWSVVRLRKTISEAREAAAAAAAAAPHGNDGSVGSHADDMQQGTQGAEGDARARAAAAAEKAVRALEAQWKECEGRLREVLTTGCMSVLSVEGGVEGGVLHVTRVFGGGHTGITHAAVSELWGALGAFGELGQQLTSISNQLLQHVLEPLLGGGMSVRVEPSSSGPSPSTTQSLSWGPSSSAPPAGVACRQVLKLVAEVLFDLDPALLRALGEALWRPFTAAYVAKHAQPAAAAALSLRAQQGLGEEEGGEEDGGVVQAARDLEEWAESLGLVEEPLLGAAVEACVVRVGSASQARHLAAARDALLTDLHHGATSQLVTVGSAVPLDAPFFERLVAGRVPAWEAEDPPCGADSEAGAALVAGRGVYHIGAGAAAVTQIVWGLMEEAAGSGSRALARPLVSAVRKVALLARTLAAAADPTTRDSLRTVPLLGALHHNGLAHLADTLLEAQAVYAAALEPVLGEGLGLVGEALALRSAAGHALSQHIACQQDALRQQLSGLGNLSRIGRASSGAAGIAHRKAVAGVVHSLGRLGRVLSITLPPEPLIQVGSQVLGSVCEAVVADVMAKADIGIEESKEIRDLLGPLATDALPALLPDPPASAAHHPPGPHGPALSGIPVQVLRDVVVARCGPLRKLRALLKLLDAGMRDIVAAWERRELQACGFDAQELEHLVCALFEASEYRRDALSRIQASAW